MNFLPSYNSARYLRRAALGLIVVSLALLAYPFAGRVNFAVAQLPILAPTITPPAVTPSPVPSTEGTVTLAAWLAAQQKPQPAQPTPTPATTPTPAGNLLEIPSIGVKMAITQGIDSKAALRQGAWLIPGTPTPDRGGNTVLGGHRYLYRPPSAKTFYNLDKVKAGDAITVTWQGKVYNYKVREVKIVEPYQVEILENTNENILTLFTCTPLFTSKQRLVVVAELLP
ncbi:MAG: class D sortase [bacterium]|nr:class D sortase [bacterium]